MQRYFAEVAYKGSRYSGWQRQPNALTVQEVIESKLSTVFNQPTSIMGCGRTDAGVHASQYFFHFDTDIILPNELSHRLNRMLDEDIAVKSIWPVAADMHTRFSATSRSYAYHLTRDKSPFAHELKTHYPQFNQLDKNLLDDCAKLILNQSEFYPFCKSNSDAETMTCQIMSSYWDFFNGEYIYYIKANRFLRGMVRLLVGMSLRVAIGEINIKSVETAFSNQTRLKKPLSAPANGLFLTQVTY